MAKTIKLRARVTGDECEVKALITHPMETGLRKNSKTGEKIPAHFIQEVVGKHNGKSVMNATWGGAVSKNPYISFKFTGANKGDTVELSWKDNLGESDSISAKIK